MCCIRSLAALTRRVHVPWMGFCFFFFFSKNKDSDGDNKRESPTQMLHNAEDGSCGKRKRLIAGGEAERRLRFVFSRAPRQHSQPLYLLQQRNYSAGRKQVHWGTIRAQPQHCSAFSYFILIPLGQMRMKLNTLQNEDSFELQVTHS